MATEPDKVDNGILGTLIAVLGFGVLGIALAVIALARTQEDALSAERSEANDAFMALRGAQEADLHLPIGYIDEKSGTVRLPIDRAMQMVVRDLRRNPQSATPQAPADERANGNAKKDAAEGAAAEDAEAPAAAPGVVRKGSDAPKDASEKPRPGPQAPRQPAVPSAPTAPDQ